MQELHNGFKNSVPHLPLACCLLPPSSPTLSVINGATVWMADEVRNLDIILHPWFLSFHTSTWNLSAKPNTSSKIHPDFRSSVSLQFSLYHHFPVLPPVCYPSTTILSLNLLCTQLNLYKFPSFRTPPLYFLYFLSKDLRVLRNLIPIHLIISISSVLMFIFFWPYTFLTV